MNPSSFSLLIFDCDGVLVDSESLSNQVLCEMVGELGLTLNVESTTTMFKGRKLTDCLAIVAERLQQPLPHDFVNNFRARSADVFKNRLQPICGIHHALSQISQTVCVASSGPREKITLALLVTGLLPRFQDRIFSSYEVGTWKPDPGLFLHAATACQAAPRTYAVIEDSLWGIQAGLAAGMTVLAYATQEEAAEFAELGATVFHDMRELPSLLNRAALDRIP